MVTRNCKLNANDNGSVSLLLFPSLA